MGRSFTNGLSVEFLLIGVCHNLFRSGTAWSFFDAGRSEGKYYLVAGSDRCVNDIGIIRIRIRKVTPRSRIGISIGILYLFQCYVTSYWMVQYR